MKRHRGKERWRLVVPRNAVSPTNSVYQTHDIVVQTCVLSHITGSRTLYSAAPFTVRYKLPSGKVKELSAKLLPQ